MADYADNIDTINYKYRAKVYIQELSGTYRTDVIVKMELNSTTFNFGLAKTDGSDFRLGEQSNGSGIYNMWATVWDYTNRIAIMWFKIPAMFAWQLLELTAFWGNPGAVSISDSDTMDAIFIEEFNTSSLDGAKWSGPHPSSLTQGVTSYGYRIPTTYDTYELNYIEPVALPLTGLREWILEFGIYVVDTSFTVTDPAFRITTSGTENSIWITYYGEGGTYGYKHNFTYGTEQNNSSGNTETGSPIYNQYYLAYKEDVDRLYTKITHRPTLDDYSVGRERKVEGNTALTNFQIYGNHSSWAENGPTCRIKWLLLRDYSDEENVSDFDLSELYTEYEHIDHQLIDHEIYGNDITSVDFEHTSNSGDPYKLSDNIQNSSYNSWVTDGTTTTGIARINFGSGGGGDLTDESFNHYDSGHVKYLNASKLSNDTDDVNDNNHWESTTSSGYACIDFGLSNNKAVSCLALQSVANTFNNMPKDITFQASTKDPRLAIDSDWVTLYSDSLEQTDDKQYCFFNNDSLYRYYKLKVLNTFGDAVIKLSTWNMYSHIFSAGKKTISKLRVIPLEGAGNENNFPKTIKFLASNDGLIWTEFFNRGTYTPFYDYGGSRWQEYSFENTKAYYIYKLECNDNWEAANNQTIIAEWSMHEKIAEEYTYRILAGDFDNYNSVWLFEGSTFDNTTFLATNNVLSMVNNDYLVYSEPFNEDVSDVNMI